MAVTVEPVLRVDIISDIICPWCVIGYRQLKAAADALDTELDVHWHPYELNPNVPPEGQNFDEHISEKYGSTPQESAKTREEITARGAEHGFVFSYNPDSRVVNTLQANKLVRWAEGSGHQHALKMALVRRYFTEGQDVSNHRILLDAVAEVGLDEADAQLALDDDSLSEQIRAEQRSWSSKGIQGVPAMIFERRHLVTGAQGVENYRRIIEQLSEDKAA